VSTPQPVIGIFGAGKVGIALARLAANAGYTVHIASSQTAADTAQVTRYFAPAAVPVASDTLAATADILVLAVPLHRFRELPLASLGGHVVIDAMNYWPPINGVLPEFEDPARPSSVVVRDALPTTARLVKTFNHLGYHQLEELPLPTGTPGRTALAIAGDDRDAIETVARLLDDTGFDPVSVGTLAESNKLEADSEVFGQALDQHQLRRASGVGRAA
jgi:predicted dinucleotide-binding enzyme